MIQLITKLVAMMQKIAMLVKMLQKITVTMMQLITKCNRLPALREKCRQ